ncbi:MAG: asparagine synthase (glutamine-hydrolyzing) [Thermodesulfobacteriota bacterium]
MCGIAGWLSWEEPPRSEVVADMSEAMSHRGPDARGLVGLGPLVLGHCRLSVIDVSPANNQPLFDHGGRLVIVFNGEIYNFPEIRADLESRGARFRTSGDTEVVLEAYRQWGVDCLARFNGMFAFALWDKARRRLFLARDRAGEKPLFYYPLPGHGLAFASEPRALRRHPQVSREIDPVGLGHYLQLNYTLGERCLTEKMLRLPPAHYLIAEEGRPPTRHRYWDLAGCFHQKKRFASEAEAAEALNALIDDSVRMRLISDVPLGAFLSGGLDSSTIVAAMTRHRPPDQVKTFSIGFDDPGYSEIDQARTMARTLGVDHHDRILRPDSAVVLPSLVAAADEPLADSSALPTWFLAGFTRSRVTVALSGDGGDECFAGYETYLADRLQAGLAWLPAWFTRGFGRLVDRFWPVSFAKVSFDYKLRQFLAGLNLPPAQAHFSWRTIFSEEERRALMRPEWLAVQNQAGADAYEIFKQHLDEVTGCHPLDQAQFVDIKTWLPYDILVKVDRATMAHSLEARVPFLDHRILEFAAALPVNYKLRGWRKKYILKLSQRRRLPAWVLKRRKQGFNAPVSDWFSQALLGFGREALAERRLDQWFDRRAIEELWRDHLTRRRDNGLKIFGLVCFSLWLQTL